MSSSYQPIHKQWAHVDDLPTLPCTTCHGSVLLVGFGERDVLKCLEALDLCADSKGSHSLEFFILSWDEFLNQSSQLQDAKLMLVQPPAFQDVQQTKRALEAIRAVAIEANTKLALYLGSDLRDPIFTDAIRSLCPVMLTDQSDCNDFGMVISSLLGSIKQQRKSATSPAQFSWQDEISFVSMIINIDNCRSADNHFSSTGRAGV